MRRKKGLVRGQSASHTQQTNQELPMLEAVLSLLAMVGEGACLYPPHLEVISWVDLVLSILDVKPAAGRNKAQDIWKHRHRGLAQLGRPGCGHSTPHILLLVYKRAGGLQRGEGSSPLISQPPTSNGGHWTLREGQIYPWIRALQRQDRWHSLHGQRLPCTACLPEPKEFKERILPFRHQQGIISRPAQLQWPK